MNTVGRVAIGVAGTGAAAAGAYGIYYLATRGSIEGIARRPLTVIDNAALTRWIERDGKEVRFADNRTAPEPKPWTHRAYQFPIPADAREVPVTTPYRTPFVPGGFNRLTSDRVKYLDAIRGILSRAGLNWDARVIMILWANESGWDRAVYGFNAGNIKSQGTVYQRDFPTLLSTKKVFVTVPESVGIMVFADRVASVDGYHAFRSAEDYARYCARILSRYTGAIPALERGGIEGAEAFARALQGGPRKYSPASVEDAVAMFRGSWNSSARLIGARYVR